jgi:glycosyltransferase involved in cell wall biosynthesis
LLPRATCGPSATVSIIIPAFNEAAGIGALLAYLRQATAD